MGKARPSVLDPKANQKDCLLVSDGLIFVCFEKDRKRRELKMHIGGRNVEGGSVVKGQQTCNNHISCQHMHQPILINFAHLLSDSQLDDNTRTSVERPDLEFLSCRIDIRLPVTVELVRMSGSRCGRCGERGSTMLHIFFCFSRLSLWIYGESLAFLAWDVPTIRVARFTDSDRIP